MKRNDRLLRAFGDINDSFIEEARPAERGQKKRSVMRWCGAAVACLLLVSLGLWLFIPYDKTPPTADEYKPSPYYSVIAALVAYNYNPPEHDNNFDAVMDGIGGIFDGIRDDVFGGAEAPGEAPEGGMNGDAGEDGYSGSVDVTDNQVAGVEEADIIKRTETHAFHLSENYLGAFTVAGKESRQISRTNLEMAFRSAGHSFMDVRAREMFLSADGGTVTVLATCIPESGRGTVVGVLSLDVRGPEQPVPLYALTLSGGYTDARRVGDSILLFTEFYSPVYPDYNDPTSFVPTITTAEGKTAIPAENVICPEVITSRRYTAIAMLDEKTLACEGAYAFLSYTDTLYVSGDSVYLTRPYTDTVETPVEGVKGGINYVNRDMTEISRLAFSEEGVEYKGSLQVEGRVKNQYAMDEYDGMLRVVTTTGYTEGRNYVYYNNLGDYSVSESGMTAIDKSRRSVSLFVFDRESFALLGSCEGFAPEGETAESVRFDGDSAYVCTAVVITFTDPVFFFDLSNPECITYTDTGDIKGYSSSLVELGEGFLLGIGTEWGGDLKLEVYEERDGAVVSVDSYTVRWCEYPEEYKSYYIDRENWLFGIPVNTDGLDAADSAGVSFVEGYALFRFDGYELTVVSVVSMGGTDINGRRGFVADGFLYVLSSAGIWVREI